MTSADPAAAAQADEDEPAPSQWQRVRAAAERPRDATLLAFIRIGFGIVMAWEGWRFIDLGRVERYYAPLADGTERFYAGYWPFEFVQPWPEPFMSIHMWVMLVAGIAVAVGAFYRLSAVVLWFTLAWVFLLDKAQYLNHMYLIVLIATLLAVLPAHRAWSVDARRKPALASDTVPAWTVWLLRFQVGVPYVFGGIAKLNRDFLRGSPLDDWLGRETGFPVIGPLFEHDPMILFMAWSALVIDLCIVAFLLHRRSRPWAYAFVFVFHVMNSRLFSIGVFPWLMILATTVFFDPSWPRRILATLRNGRDPRRDWVIAGAMLGAAAGLLVPLGVVAVQIAVGAVGGAVLVWHMPFWPAAVHHDEQLERSRVKRLAKARARQGEPDDEVTPPARPWLRPLATALVLAWVAVQIVVPLRHWTIPGDVNWTEDGHKFAWRMKLRQKYADLTLYEVDPATGARTEIDLDRWMDDRQQGKTSSRPDMIVQFAHWLEDQAGRDMVIQAESRAGLNDRPEQVFVLPDVDLTEVPWPWWGRAPHVAQLQDR